jgi:hypothetical protein
MAKNCQSRPAIAHRDPTANTLQGWFPGSGQSEANFGQTRRLPRPCWIRWLNCRVHHSITVAGAAPARTGFPILPRVSYAQAPRAS